MWSQPPHTPPHVGSERWRKLRSLATERDWRGLCLTSGNYDGNHVLGARPSPRAVLRRLMCSLLSPPAADVSARPPEPTGRDPDRDCSRGQGYFFSVGGSRTRRSLRAYGRRARAMRHCPIRRLRPWRVLARVYSGAVIVGHMARGGAARACVGRQSGRPGCSEEMSQCRGVSLSEGRVGEGAMRRPARGAHWGAGPRRSSEACTRR